jgi:hypothetical protein
MCKVTIMCKKIMQMKMLPREWHRLNKVEYDQENDRNSIK